LHGYEYNYGGNKKSFPYELNTKINSSDDTISRYFTGLSSSEGDHIWSNGKESTFRAHIEQNITDDLKVEILSGTFNTQRVRIYANKKFITNKTATETELWSFIVPKEYVKDDNILTLKFKYLDAVSPKILGISEDPRVLAIAFSEMSISEVSNDNLKDVTGSNDVANKYELNTKINSSDDTISRYFTGLSSSEGGHIWSNGKESTFRAHIEQNIINDLKVEIFSWPFGEQRVKIFANELPIEEKTFSTSSIWSFIIPKNYLQKDGVLTIRFEYPDATSPQALGISDDARILAIAFSQMTIFENK
jgi:hypothetical protein